MRTEPHRQQDQSLLMQGLALQKAGRINEALKLYRQILQQDPDYLDVLQLSLGILDQLQDYLQAEELLSRALLKSPNSSYIHDNLGKVRFELGRHEAALQSHKEAMRNDPSAAEPHFNMGNVLHTLGQLDLAISFFNQAIKLDPSDPLAYFNRGNVLNALGQLDAALNSFNKATELAPNYSDAWVNRGSVLSEMQCYEEALVSFDKAIALDPNHADAWLNAGIVFNKLRHHEKALAALDRATVLNPNLPDAWSNRGITLHELKRYEDALNSYERAMQLKPEMDFLLGNFLYTKILIADWDGLDASTKLLIERIEAGNRVIFPHALLGMSDSPHLQLMVAKTWSEDDCPERNTLPPIQKVSHQKIRLGYYSADYYNHATSYLMAEFFELHDRSQFELIAFSFGPNIHDESRFRLTKTFDQFIDVSHLSDESIAKLSREIGIDIAIDLKGYTKNCRTGIFSYRAAPIQVNYLGYPGTMGLSYMDYIIADPVLIPNSSKNFYSEKIVYLPNSYQVNDTKRLISDKTFTKAEAGLPESGFVFCCFNNNYKISPKVLDGWARILKKVDGSVLWLLEDNLSAKQNLIKEAQRRGVSKERLVFAGRLTLSEHLARHRLADIFLDTVPCNAHTTASDALWTGLPVITLLGETFAGRVAASLLNAIGLPELIARDQSEYEALAIDYATNPSKLKSIKDQLRINRLTTPLFDSNLYTQHIEYAYKLMYERYQADLSPEHLYIKP